MHLGARQKWVVFAAWLALLAVFWGYLQSRGVGPRALTADAVALFTASAWGPLLLLALYLVRPLVLLPVTLLTVASGFLFGPLWGFVYALFAMLASSALAYGLAYLFGAGPAAASNPRARRLAAALRRHGFETVLVGRFLFVPGDLINYSAGYVRVNAAAFLLASAIGGAPGLLAGALAGAALEGPLTGAKLHIDAATLLGSALLLALSLAAAALLKRHTRQELTE